MNMKSIKYILIFAVLALSSTVYATYEPNQQKITVNINRGWNLVPLFAWETESKISAGGMKNVDFKYKFVYQQEQNKYVLAEKNGQPTQRDFGFDIPLYASGWVYSEQDGQYSFGWGYPGFNSDHFALSQIKLSPGWNFTFVSPNMIGKTLNDIKGTCTFTKVYSYAKEGGEIRWLPLHQTMGLGESFSNYSVGFGLVIKVPTECHLGESIPAVPQLPE
ncbi:MAG: hypothetical protein AAB529_02750 [Patescibacteria group bacterium]